MPSFPFPQNFIDRAIRGDYVNIFATIDLTIPRLKRSLFLGTRWGDPNAPLVPAPGDPAHLNYTYEPLNVGVTPPPPDGDPGAPPPPSALSRSGARRERHFCLSPRPQHPLLPPASSVFAGPYPPGAGGS